MNRPLEITGLTKIFPTAGGSPYIAVKDVNVTIAAGEFVSLVGHSGCGKSTVLSIVAGLQPATFGGVCIDGKEVDGPGPERAVVFQSPSLLPWLTAGENVRLAVSQSRARPRRAEQTRQARRYLELVGVAGCYDRNPAELSQGTQQQVSLARALSQEPRFLLLDEPFGMLDSLTRFDLQDILLQAWEHDRKTVLMVTHDVDEALYLSDRILLMTDGPAARIGEILEVRFPRPRERSAVLSHPDYARQRSRVIRFLENHVRSAA